ncbi:MAG: DJ-1/PfpI family protein [Pseudomonadota bacterium]
MTIRQWLFIGTLSMQVILSSYAHADHDRKIQVGILMFEGVQIIDFSGPYEIFGQAGFKVFTVAKTQEPLKTAMGLEIIPAYDFDNAPSMDIILVPGGSVYQTSKDRKTQQWLQKNSASAQHVLSVCTGSDILAEAKLLDGLSATTFHRHIGHFAKKFPDITLKPEARYVDNGKIITTAGLSSGIDGALHLVSKIKGIDFAKTVALHVEYFWDPDKPTLIRATLADRVIPDLDIDFPEETQVQRVKSLGDKTFWEAHHEVASSLDTTKILDLIDEAMLSYQQWKPTKHSDRFTKAWHLQGPESWTLEISAKTVSDNKTRIELVVNQRTQ